MSLLHHSYSTNGVRPYYSFDLVRELSSRTLLPVMAYNVSGEYSMIHAAAAAGYCDLYATARESLYAIFRAGATQVISYWAPFYAEIFKECRV